MVVSPPLIVQISKRHRCQSQVLRRIGSIGVSMANYPPPRVFPHLLGSQQPLLACWIHYLIVAGGANFPAGHPFFDQAIKAYYADLWLFDTTLPELRPAYHLELPYPVAHGALVQTEQSILLIGGQNAEGALSAILEVSVVAGQPSIKQLGGITL